MALVRSLLFNTVFYTGSLMIVLALVPTSLLGRRAVQRHARSWAYFHRWCARRLMAVTTRIEGEVPAGPVLVAAKHESMYETMEVVVILDTPAVVLKRELADIPLWGRAAQVYGCIPVDREGSAAALRQMTRDARAVAEGGRQVVIFPEGTRVPRGETPPLRPGFAGLYRALGYPVVPVALDSGDCMPKGFLKRPGSVTMRFGEPIPPGLPRREVEARVHAGINALNRCD